MAVASDRARVEAFMVATAQLNRPVEAQLEGNSTRFIFPATDEGTIFAITFGLVTDFPLATRY